MFLQFRKLIISITAAAALCVAVPAYAGGMPNETDLKKLEAELQKDAEKRDKLPEEEDNAPAMTQPEPLAADEKDLSEPPAEDTPVVAETTETPEPPKKDNSIFSSLGSRAGYMGLSIGYFDAHDGNNEAISFGAEWKPGIRIARIFQPMIGGLATTEGNLFGYAGLGVPMKLGDKVLLTPSVALGALGGGNDDLGQTLTYRIGGELAYLLDNGSRIGLSGQMITNGESMGSDDRIDVIALTYTIPLGPTDGKGAAKQGM